jgi:hypothetical protein
MGVSNLADLDQGLQAAFGRYCGGRYRDVAAVAMTDALLPPMPPEGFSALGTGARRASDAYS